MDAAALKTRQLGALVRAECQSKHGLYLSPSFASFIVRCEAIRLTSDAGVRRGVGVGGADGGGGGGGGGAAGRETDGGGGGVLHVGDGGINDLGHFDWLGNGLSEVQQDAVISNSVAFIIRAMAAVAHTSSSSSSSSTSGDPSSSTSTQLLHSTMSSMDHAEALILSSAFETMRLQVEFELAYSAAGERLQNADTAREAQLGELVQDAVDCAAQLSSSEDVAELYRAIFKALLRHGCLSYVDRTVEREVAAALESVFPQTGLTAFALLSAADKRAQLMDLVDVVLGIRLFNRSIGKGGAGMVNAPDLCEEETAWLHDELAAELASVSNKTRDLIHVINLEYRFPSSIVAPILGLQSELAFRTQYRTLIAQLFNEVQLALERLSVAHRELEAALMELRDLVGRRVSVPKEQVYPKFHLVADMWRAIEHERAVNSARTDILRALRSLKDNVASGLTAADLELYESNRERLEELEQEEAFASEDGFDFVRTAACVEESHDGETVRLTPDSCEEFLTLDLECQGMCPWTIVRRAGLVLPGNVNLGVLALDGHVYAFSSVEAMRQFVRSPRTLLEDMEASVCRRPELICLLGLQERIPFSAVHELIYDNTDDGTLTLGEDASGATPVRAEVGVQTPVHFVEAHVDPNYEWNEWQLRRRLLQLADLTNRRTHSTQTHLSHYRRDAETQTWVKAVEPDGTMPGVGTMTGISKATNVARTSRYMAGLRGRPSRRMQVVQLTHASTVTERSNALLSGKEKRFADSSN